MFYYPQVQSAFFSKRDILHILSYSNAYDFFFPQISHVLIKKEDFQTT